MEKQHSDHSALDQSDAVAADRFSRLAVELADNSPEAKQMASLAALLEQGKSGPFAIRQTDYEAAEHISSLILEVTRLSQRIRMPSITYYLSMAYIEGCDIRRGIVRARPKHQRPKDQKTSDAIAA